MGVVDRDSLARWLAEHDKAQPNGAPRRATTWLHEQIAPIFLFDFQSQTFYRQGLPFIPQLHIGEDRATTAETALGA